MQIWPAIDLRGGKCVRLVQGDYDRETGVRRRSGRGWPGIWSSRRGPNACIWSISTALATGEPVNWDSLRAILAAVDVPCELGGGIRDEPTIQRLLDLGLEPAGDRHPGPARSGLVSRRCPRGFPDRLVLGIDARDGQVATDGWLETSSVAADELARQFDDEPLAAIIYTDIATDGMLVRAEPAGDAANARSGRLAAGRFRRRDHGRTTSPQLAALDVAGCIIGRALYEGTLNLPEALAAAG